MLFSKPLYSRLVSFAKLNISFMSGDYMYDVVLALEEVPGLVRAEFHPLGFNGKQLPFFPVLNLTFYG